MPSRGTTYCKRDSPKRKTRFQACKADLQKRKKRVTPKRKRVKDARRVKQCTPRLSFSPCWCPEIHFPHPNSSQPERVQNKAIQSTSGPLPFDDALLEVDTVPKNSTIGIGPVPETQSRYDDNGVATVVRTAVVSDESQGASVGDVTPGPLPEAQSFDDESDDEDGTGGVGPVPEGQGFDDEDGAEPPGAAADAPSRSASVTPGPLPEAQSFDDESDDEDGTDGAGPVPEEQSFDDEDGAEPPGAAADAPSAAGGAGPVPEEQSFDDDDGAEPPGAAADAPSRSASVSDAGPGPLPEAPSFDDDEAAGSPVAAGGGEDVPLGAGDDPSASDGAGAADVSGDGEDTPSPVVGAVPQAATSDDHHVFFENTIDDHRLELLESGVLEKVLRLVSTMSIEGGPDDANVAGSIDERKLRLSGDGCHNNKFTYGDDSAECGVAFYEYSRPLSVEEMVRWIVRSGLQFGFVTTRDRMRGKLHQDVISTLLSDIGTRQPLHLFVLYTSSGVWDLVSRFGRAHETVDTKDDDGITQTVYDHDEFSGLRLSSTDSTTWTTESFADKHWRATTEPFLSPERHAGVQDVPVSVGEQDAPPPAAHTDAEEAGGTNGEDSPLTIDDHKERLLKTGVLEKLFALISTVSLTGEPVKTLVAGSIAPMKLLVGGDRCESDKITYGENYDECGVSFFQYSSGFTVKSMVDWLVKSGTLFGFMILPSGTGYKLTEEAKEVLLTDVGTEEPLHLALLHKGSEKDSGTLTFLSKFGRAHQVVDTKDENGLTQTVYAHDAYNGFRQLSIVDIRGWEVEQFADKHWDATTQPNVRPQTVEPTDGRGENAASRPSNEKRKPRTTTRRLSPVRKARPAERLPLAVVHYYDKLKSTGNLKSMMNVLKGISHANHTSHFLHGIITLEDIKGCDIEKVRYVTPPTHGASKCGISSLVTSGASPEKLGVLPGLMFDKLGTIRQQNDDNNTLVGFVVTGVGLAVCFDAFAKFVTDRRKTNTYLPDRVHVVVIDPEKPGRLSVLSVHGGLTLQTRNYDTNGISYSPASFLEKHLKNVSRD